MNPRYSRYEIDWALLLSALRLRSQIPVYRWARAFGVHHTVIQNLIDGVTREPRWSLAMDLLDAAADHLTPEDSDQIRGWMRA